MIAMIQQHKHCNRADNPHHLPPQHLGVAKLRSPDGDTISTVVEKPLLGRQKNFAPSLPDAVKLFAASSDSKARTE